MRFIIGLIISIFGVAAGLYVGLYLCLYCGGVDVIHAVQMKPIDAGMLVWGLMRVFILAGVSGIGSFLVISGIGVSLLK